MVAFGIGKLPQDPKTYIQKAEAEVTKDKPNWNNIFKYLGKAIKNSDDLAQAELLYRVAELRYERLEREPNLSRPERTEQAQSGQGALERAIRKNPNHLKARRMLAELYRGGAISNPRNTKAWLNYIAELDGILAIDLTDAKSHFQRGAAYARLADTDPMYQKNAVEDFRKAAELDPTNADHWNTLAKYLAATEKPDEAEQAFREAIKANPKKAMLRVGYAMFLRNKNRLEESKKLVQEAIQCEPSSPLGYIAQSQNYLRKKPPQYDQAEATLKKAQAIDKTDTRVYRQLVFLYRLRGQQEKAAKALREGLAALEQEDIQDDQDDRGGARRRGQARAMLNYMLADVLLDMYASTKKEEERKTLLDEAKSCHEVLVTLSPHQPQRYRIAGRIAYNEKKWAQAREDLEKVVNHDRTLRTAVMLLDIYRKLNIPGQSEKLAKGVLQNRNLTRKGRLLFLSQLAQLQMNMGKYDKAQALVSQASSIDPNDETIKNLQQGLDAYRGKTDIATGGQGVQRVTRTMLLRRVQDLASNDRFEEAEDILEKILDKDPRDLQVLLRLVSLLMQNQKRERALEWVTRAQKKDPQNEDLQRLEAVLKEPDLAKRYEIEMSFIDRAPSEDKLLKTLQKCSIAARYGKSEEVKKYLAEAETIDPNSPMVIRIRFRQALQEKNWSEAETLIERLGEAGKKDSTQDSTQTSVLDFQRARLAMARGREEKNQGNKEQSNEQFEKAISCLQRAQKNAPHLPMPRLLMADCYLQLEKREDARQQYRKCYEDNHQNLQAMIGLAKLAEETERLEERDRWIEEAYQLPQGKTNSFVREQFLRMLEANPQNLREALHKREQVLKRDPDNLGNAFRLAALYERSGQVNRAQEMIEYVYQRTPRKIAIAPMLADLYLRMNRSAKADEMFSDLLKKAKKTAEKVQVLIAYADFLTRTDEMAALRIYNKAIMEEGDTGSRAMQAMGNFYSAQARALAARGKRRESQTKWDEAIALIRKAVERDPGDKVARMVMLGRYVDAGQYDKAIEGYQKMIDANSNDLEARVGLGLAYLQEDQLDKAKAEFDEVIKMDPDMARAYLLRSRVYQSLMELPKAAADIKTCAMLTRNVAQQMDLARIYEAMGDQKQAQQIYNTILSSYPEYFPAYRNVLNLLRSQKRWSAMDTLAREGMKRFPNNPYFASALASAAQEQGQKKDRLHWLERAAEVAPNDVMTVRRYLMALLKDRDYTRLQREAQKYAQNPAQNLGVQAIMVAAEAKRNPDSPKPFQVMLGILQKCKNPMDIYFLGELLREAYGSAKIVAQSSDILKAKPKNWHVYSMMGDSCLQEKKYQQAGRNYLQALELCKGTPGEVRVRLRLAQLYDKERAYSKVEAQYRAILKDNPNNIVALNNLAYTCIDQLNQPEEGLRLMKRAMKLTPGDPNLVDTYAWALAKLGRYDDAREMLEKVMNKSSGGADSLYHMGFVLEKTGSASEAKGYYRRAMEVARSQKRAALLATIETAMARVEQELGKE